MKKKHLPIIIMVIIVVSFLAGIFFGKATTTDDEITNLLRQSELATESYILEQDLIADIAGSSCEVAKKRIETHSQELYQIGQRLASENARESLGDQNYILLKKKYHLLQIRTYVLYKKISEVCSLETHIILFYFSQDDHDSEKQGTILDELVSEYSLVVFAIEHDYAPELVFLEQYYGVTTTPSLIFDFQKVFKGKTDKHELLPLLNQENDRSEKN